MQQNMRTLLKQLPGKGRALRLAGSGRLVPKIVGNKKDTLAEREDYWSTLEAPSGSGGHSAEK